MQTNWLLGRRQPGTSIVNDFMIAAAKPLRIA
jgi:hypothetical protein